MDEAIKTSNKIERDELGRILPGQAPLNPNGRPKGKTLKEFAREYYSLKTDEEKVAYINSLEEKKPGFAWEMAEGRPSQDTDITSGGQRVQFIVAKEIADKNAITSKPEQDSQ